MTLAEKCFNNSEIEQELFDIVNKILGVDTDDCLNDSFVWGAVDVGWDYYDGSIEVIRPEDVEFMTREQADQILDLGFGVVYESVGEKALYWTKTHVHPVSPRQPNENSRLKTQIKTLINNRARAENELKMFSALVSSNFHGRHIAPYREWLQLHINGALAALMPDKVNYIKCTDCAFELPIHESYTIGSSRYCQPCYKYVTAEKFEQYEKDNE